jgi:hypothetical protein
VKKNLALPEDLVAKVDLELFSPLEGRVPTGAWQDLTVQLLEDWLRRRYGAGSAATQELSTEGA